MVWFEPTKVSATAAAEEEEEDSGIVLGHAGVFPRPV